MIPPEKNVAGIAVIISLVALYIFSLVGGGYHQSLGRQAESILTQCSTENDSEKCYEREVPKLYPQLNVLQLFEIIRYIRGNDSTYQFCHVLAHKIGEQVVALDPSGWVNAISLNPPDGYCSNGFIHGIIGGRFRAEVLDDKELEALIPDFRTACEPRLNWNPSGLDQAICYHGMGHLYDFITDANLNKALDLCERTTDDQFRRVCYEGVFMQIYQPLEPDDYLMIERMPVKPATTTVRQFCSAFGRSEYKGACLRESWPFFRSGILEGIGAESFCSGQPNQDEEVKCYQSISAIVGRMSLGEPEKAISACSKFPEDRQDICFSASAEAVLEENRSDAEGAVALCKLAPETHANECMITLIRHAASIFGEDKLRYNRFCGLLPNGLKQQCAQADKVSSYDFSFKTGD